MSTGPRTAEGKAISSQNARTHGLSSASPFIPADQRPAYDALESNLRASHDPDGADQEEFFRIMLANAWNLRRIERMEAEADDDKFLKLQRYRGAAERAYHRAHKELKELQRIARFNASMNPAFLADPTKRTPAAANSFATNTDRILDTCNRIRERLATFENDEKEYQEYCRQQKEQGQEQGKAA